MSDNSVVKTSKANHGLLPCPFCGTDAELNTASNSPDWMIISCPNITCAVNPGIEGLYDELADVVAAWNKRPTIEELRREVANWRSASETNLATCKRLREQLKAHGNETGEPRQGKRVWIASKGTEKALTLSEADGWEVHEVVKAPVYRANSPEDIKQSMDILQQIHQESNTQWLAYGCEKKPFAHWRQECSADCPHAQKASEPR